MASILSYSLRRYIATASIRNAAGPSAVAGDHSGNLIIPDGMKRLCNF